MKTTTMQPAHARPHYTLDLHTMPLRAAATGQGHRTAPRRRNLWPALYLAAAALSLAAGWYGTAALLAVAA